MGAGRSGRRHRAARPRPARRRRPQRPCLGLLDGTPMSYWEVYRADLDPLAGYYPARPQDTGVHLLLGPADHRGRGLGATLIAALADRVLRERPGCERVVAEPDVRNRRSVRAFERAGFTPAAELDLPGKRAALMVRDRDRVLRGRDRDRDRDRVPGSDRPDPNRSA
ncbi:GNAT family N-acetyltransferase [Kitasatospora aburaviensis]